MLHQEMLIMAMTRRQSGICTAGFINQTHPESGLCWVRPVKKYSTLRLGDMTDGTGQICRLGDVVRLKLLEPRPEPPHPEDWLTDFIRQRPVIDRQLTGYRRSEFLQKYVDNNPAAVLTVTDLKWQTLGRQWCQQSQQEQNREYLMFDHDQLCQRIQAESIYLSIGLSRVYRNKIWPLIIGVHPVPDYDIEVDYCGL